MQIFLSHSSKQKPLVREIRRYLPAYLGSWIDEKQLLFGDNIGTSIEATIKSDMDYVLLFIDEHAATSSWVAKELEWALQAEKILGRTILLPIVIAENALRDIGSIEIQNRKHLKLKDFQESSVRALADSIASDLFALVCRDMDRLRTPKPKTPSATIADADALLSAHAALIRKIVFPHRKPNPISRETLRNVVNSQDAEPIGADEFEKVLSSVVQRNLIPGLLYDGFELFLLEEHASWKSEVHHQRKEKVGRKAVGFIQNGMKIILDAGSTVEEVVRLLCKKIENRALTKLTIATTSINIADMISDCCVSMGFDDNFSAVRLYVPGGQVRPSTQAIVPMFGSERGQIQRLADQIGGFDLSIIGVNGIDATAGFTTHDNAEAMNKIDLARASGSRLIVGDSSKIGIVLEYKFADLEEEFKLIVDNNQESQELCNCLGSRASKIILA
ncbi:MAG: TIR domain-containing protein [Betaproteobacteria bacterium]|nr:TIR domain-containing protein [Betaproteobacteria bacterium]